MIVGQTAMKSNSLTPKQKKVLDFVTYFVDKHDYSPSLAEIAKHFRSKSTSTIHQYIEALAQKGYLNKIQHKQRSLTLVVNEVEIPLFGYIAAGEPIEAISNPEPIKVPQSMLTKSGLHYALKVKGNSMIEENIHDGDTVVIRRQETAENGQKVIALLNGNGATLKKIYKEKNGFRLQPANSSMKPILVKEVVIQGIVTHVIPSNIPQNQQKTNYQKIESFLNRIIEGDCLEVMKNIPPQSIDMILCDLPYGTTQNLWDSVIPLDQLWQQYERVIKNNGVIALTAQGTFSAKLMLSNPKIFKYKIVWVKSKPTNFLNAKKQPLRKHEDILIFYKNQPHYNPQMSMGEPYNKGYRKNQLTGSYGDFGVVEVKSNGERYPTDVIYFKTAESEGTVYHPTQKPVELGRYLIKTFTKPGGIVLDNTCGSGSFLVSAVFEGRKFIGIEKNQEVYMFKNRKVNYIEVCKQRTKAAQEQYELEANKLRLF